MLKLANKKNIKQVGDNLALDAAQAGFVEFSKVQKSYDSESLVVKDLNLSVGKGEF